MAEACSETNIWPQHSQSFEVSTRLRYICDEWNGRDVDNFRPFVDNAGAITFAASNLKFSGLP